MEMNDIYVKYFDKKIKHIHFNIVSEISHRRLISLTILKCKYKLYNRSKN